jgi:hypothetical protein
MATIKEEAESITEIDKDNLDKECISLPSNYRRFAFLSAEAKRDMLEAKAYLEVISAQLSLRIRSHPGKFGIEKITESIVSATILVQDQYAEGQKAFLKAQHRHEMTSAVVWALEHKKKALTLLVELHGLGYFADVKMSAKGKEAVEEMTKKQVRTRRRMERD